jgi:NitT/TauT family transport system substrate-binding protein
VSIYVTPLMLAIDGGLFKKYDVNVEAGGVMQSPAIVASILSGETPFALAGPDAVISADLNGGDIVILVSGTEKLLFSVYGAKDVRTIADLKGKRIGVTQFGTTTDFIARHLLKQSASQKVTVANIIPLGTQANMLTALLGGAVDAAVLGVDITLKATRAGQLNGFNLVTDMSSSDVLYYSASLISKKSWVAAHSAETLNVVRGYLAGVAAVFMDKNAALAALRKSVNSTDPDEIEAAYQLLLRVLPKVPVPKASVVRTNLVASSLSGARDADPRSFIDTSFVDTLAQNGFIGRLYQR